MSPPPVTAQLGRCVTGPSVPVSDRPGALVLARKWHVRRAHGPWSGDVLGPRLALAVPCVEVLPGVTAQGKITRRADHR